MRACNGTAHSSNVISPVKETVTIVRTDLGADKVIVSYVVPSPAAIGDQGNVDTAVVSRTLKSHLRGCLPNYMIPTHIVILQVGHPRHRCHCWHRMLIVLLAPLALAAGAAVNAQREDQSQGATQALSVNARTGTQRVLLSLCCGGHMLWCCRRANSRRTSCTR